MWYGWGSSVPYRTKVQTSNALIKYRNLLIIISFRNYFGCRQTLRWKNKFVYLFFVLLLIVFGFIHRHQISGARWANEKHARARECSMFERPGVTDPYFSLSLFHSHTQTHKYICCLLIFFLLVGRLGLCDCDCEYYFMNCDLVVVGWLMGIWSGMEAKSRMRQWRRRRRPIQNEYHTHWY